MNSTHFLMKEEEREREREREREIERKKKREIERTDLNNKLGLLFKS